MVRSRSSIQYDHLAAQALHMYRHRVYPTRLAWLYLIEKYMYLGGKERLITSAELLHFALKHTTITRAAITSNLRRASRLGWVEIEKLKTDNGHLINGYRLSKTGTELLDTLRKEDEASSTTPR